MWKNKSKKYAYAIMDAILVILIIWAGIVASRGELMTALLLLVFTLMIAVYRVMVKISNAYLSSRREETNK